MGENTLRALASDLAYLESWAMAATDDALPWPASESLALKFVAHHLWDPAKRAVDPLHGMPAGVAARLHTGVLRSAGPHAPSTVKRRGRPSKHSANGWSVPTSARVRSSGPSTRWEAGEEKGR